MSPPMQKSYVFIFKAVYKILKYIIADLDKVREEFS